MCAAVAALLVLPKLNRKAVEDRTDTVTITQPSGGTPVTPTPPPGAGNNNTAVTPATPANVTTPPTTGTGATLQTGVLAHVLTVPVMTNDAPEAADIKPLPVLEKNYLATTNRDDRLDIMMDISDAPGPESIRTLARLFQAETDPDLKVDLLDSLLGIEGNVEEKLALLTLGTAKGLPKDVRQAAIDGLIDLDDPRVISILNGLLNDPDEEIRENSKDALEMLQNQSPVKLIK